MKIINQKEILHLWESNTKPIALYIHSPFCASQCTYCVYRGTSFSQEEFNKFYSDYILKDFEAFENIIKSNKIQSIYFGGGTPNIGGTLDHLLPIFNKIKSIKCNEKIIELHMGFPITNQHIDMLKDYGFTTIILCQQTFDNKTLMYLNRKTTQKNKISDIIKYIHSKGMYVGLDLMVYPELSNNLLQEDLQVLNTLQEKPDEITFAPNYLTKDNFDVGKILDNILNSEVISNFYIKANGINFYTPQDSHINCLRFFTAKGFNLFQSNKFYSFLEALQEGVSNGEISTLGIGSYKNPDKNVYSKIGTSYTYYEVNNDLKNPEYHLIATTPVYDQIANLFNYFKENATEEFPQDAEFIIRSKGYHDYYDCDPSNRKSVEDMHRINSEIDPIIEIAINNCPEYYNEYLNKFLGSQPLKNILLNK